MGRSIEIPGALRGWTQYLLAGAVVASVQWAVVLVSGAVAGPVDLSASGPLLLTLGLSWLLLTLGWVRWARRQAGSGSFWAPIPEEQYLGRFAGAGGLARREWERALPGSDDDE